MTSARLSTSVPALACALLTTLLLGCPDSGSSGDDASDDPCVPGASIGCECAGGLPGARVCEPDGIGYGPCSCDGDDGPATSSSPDPTEGDPPDPDPDTGSDPDDTGSPPPTTDTEGGVPDFQDDIVPIFYTGCGAGSNACHARNAYFADVNSACRGWVSFEDMPLGSVFDDLDPETMMESEGPTGCPDLGLYDRLMQLAPWECDASSSYVSPGSLEGSYIFVKLTNGTSCGDFRLMPPPGEGYEITDTQIETLRQWILAGAPP